MSDISSIDVLIIGSGGREHALAWKVACSHQVNKVFVAPGNGGTALETTGNIENVPIEALDIETLIQFAKKNAIDLTIVGPEAPLAMGIVDAFEKNNLACFGPTQAAAQLETSKAFCKQFLKDENIPTACFKTFTDTNQAIKYLQTQALPIVIKASGLATGKGVTIARTYQEAKEAITAILDDKIFEKHLGESFRKHNPDIVPEIVIEEFLEGEELSFIAMVDGEDIVPFPESQDHKHRDDGDKGPNTGGMGAYSPVSILTDSLRQRIMQEIIEPTVKALVRRSTPYRGFLYAGLMISASGEINLLEYNCRLGDPEAQVLLFRLKSDLIELFLAALAGQLKKKQVQWDSRPAICLVLVAGGYPSSYQQGDIIEGLDTEQPQNCKIFHAGTYVNPQGNNTEHHGNVLTHGGRVLGITAKGVDLQTARNITYSIAKKIYWPNYYYRQDIAHRALETV